MLLLAGQTLLLSGCATKALWENGRFARFHEPNEPPNLRLFYSERRQDVLVQYVDVMALPGCWEGLNEAGGK